MTAAAVIVGALLVWLLVVRYSPGARTKRRRLRNLRRKYPMAHERDLRRMAR